MLPSGCETSYFSNVILTKEGQAVFTQQANDMVDALFRHINASCEVLTDLSLEVKKEALSNKDKHRGLSESPQPIVPAFFSINMSAR